VEILAKADVDGEELTSLKTTVPADTRRQIEELIKNPVRSSKTLTADRVGDHPIMGPLCAIIGHPDAAFMGFGPKPEWNLLPVFLSAITRVKSIPRSTCGFLGCSKSPLPLPSATTCVIGRSCVCRMSLRTITGIYRMNFDSQVGDEIVGANFGLKRVMEMVSQVASLSSPVLLLGKRALEKRS